MAEILTSQCSDGGWTLAGDTADVDMTAMALTALAYLSDAQQEDGDFMS